MIDSGKSKLGGLAAAIAVMLLLTGTANASVSNKIVFTGEFGREVNLTEFDAHAGLSPELEDVCTIASGDQCQVGKKAKNIQGGFEFPEGVAAGPGPTNYVYVADKVNNRVQVFTATGAFVEMFGWKVNATTGGNACTEAEINATPKATCQNGQTESKGVAGVIGKPVGVAVDGATGDFYVWDTGDHRIEAYGPGGEFILMIGKEVNETNDAKAGATEEEKNVCTEAEISATPKAACKIGVASAAGSSEHGAFKPAATQGNILTFGGPEKLLYVGDEGRVQEFESNGKWVRNISLTSIASAGQVRALAVEEGTGDVYLIYKDSAGTGGNGIRVFNNPALPAEPQQVAEVDAGGSANTFALDSFGRLAVVETEPARHGVLLEASSGKKLGEFEPATTLGGMGTTSALAFNSAGALYGADNGHQAIDMYVPAPVATLVTGSTTSLTATGVTLDGEINPENVNGTRAWFQYGTSLTFGSNTAIEDIATGSVFVPLAAKLENLRPNQKYYYRVAAQDETVPAPEPPLVGDTLSFDTPPLPPAIEAAPQTPFVHSESAVLSGSLNPENAVTRYHFEYGPCTPLSSCASTTTDFESSVYSQVGVTQEIVGLSPSTTYHDRLVATNEHKETTEGPEGAFTTGPGVVVEAATGPASAIAATSAVVSGTVNPDGQPASYTFELGVYNGSSTRYGTVLSGPAGEGTTPVSEQLALSGLQPGTTYAYLIKVESGYGSAAGAPLTFTTSGLPAGPIGPALIPQLQIPNIEFPGVAVEPASKPLTRAQKLANALKACNKRPKKRRASCRSKARKRYGAKPKGKKK